MKILVINSGSSSLKFQLINMTYKKTIARGLFERIGEKKSCFHFRKNSTSETIETAIKDHSTAISTALNALTSRENGILKDITEIDAVGHRMVHGGEKINKAEVLTPEIEQIMEDNAKLAPLHNPAMLKGFIETKKLLPDIPHVAVFDTAFHSTMPPHAYIYGLPYEYYSEHGIRRFGFHGPSHHYIARRTAEILGKGYDEVNCITCHMGNGVSIVAIKNGKSVDTSLGFGTMCGVPMGTRAGDFDPDILLYCISHLGLNADEMKDVIYKKSGLKGISGLSNDMRDIVDGAESGNERASLALNIFAHTARKHIAALATNLTEGMDALVFTAGIGENSIRVREEICRGLEFIGIRLDPEKNHIRGEESEISADDSPVKILVVPTNEELMIAMETEEIIRG